MRVMHVIDSAGIYGAEIVLLNLAQEQRRAGLAPIILSIGNTTSGIKALEVEAQRLDLRCIALRMRDGLNLRGAKEIIELAQRERIDVIHSHGYKSNILLALLPRSARRIPVVATLHGWTAKKLFSKLGIYRLLDQWLLPRLDGVAAVSSAMMRLPPLRRMGNRVSHIPNGIVETLSSPPNDALAIQLRAWRSEGDIVIGGIGRLSAEKNFSALLDAFVRVAARHANLRLIILGDGPEKSTLVEHCGQLGLDGGSILRGYTANAQNYLGLFDVFALPSLTEGLPMVILEALAASVPIIATAVGGVPDAIADIGRNVPAGDRAALATAIEFFLDHRANEIERAKRGPARIAERYSAAAMCTAYSSLYRSVQRTR